MDTKLKMMADFSTWQELFPEFRKKGIRIDVLALLSQPQYRYGLIRLIAEGKYQLDAPREASIPKDSGGTRLIYILPDIDRCVMSVVTRVYEKLYGGRIHPTCRSYQQGLSVPETLHSIYRKLGCGGYKADLSKYFDSVPRWKINSMLKDMGTGSPVDRMLWDFYNTDLILRDGRLTEHFKSLGQGCAFSTLLANLCLAEVDEKLAGLCEVYVRYSDDLLFLGAQADEALAVLKERLLYMGLELNSRKVQKIGEDSVFTFLGGKICNSWVHISDKEWGLQKKAVRSITHRIGTRGSRNSQQKAVRALLKHFTDRSSGYCMLEYFCFLCTDEADMLRLDEYCRDEIKAVYTGRHNHTANEHKTSNEMIRGWGWGSLVHLYRLYKMSRHVFYAKIAAIREQRIAPAHVVDVETVWLTPDLYVNLSSGLVRANGQYVRVRRKKRGNVFERIEELWPAARQYESFTAMNVTPDTNRVFTSSEKMETELAIKEIELLIVTTEFNLDRYFWQSRVFPDLIIFKEWTINK